MLESIDKGEPIDMVQEGVDHYSNSYFCQEDEKRLIRKRKDLERKVCLREILYDLLDDKEKQIIDMRFKENLCVFDIVEVLYISESTYYRRLKKIYEKLYRYYDSFEDLFY